MGKEFFILIGGRAAQALLSIAALRVMTTFLTPAEVGNFYLLLSFATGFGFFLVNPVGMYINRKLHSWDASKKILDRFAVFNIYLLGVSLLALLVTAAGKVLIGSGPGMPVWTFSAAVAVYVYCSTWNMTLIPALNMLGHRVSFVVLTVLTTGWGLLFSLLAVKYMQAGAFFWISGQMVAMFIAAIAALYTLKRMSAERFSGLREALSCVNTASLGSVRAFALPLAGAAVFMWLQTQGYRLIVEAKVGAEFLGYLGVGLGISASLAAISESLVQQIYYPGFYKKITAENPDARRAALSILTEKALPVYLILLAFTVSLAPQLTGLLVDSKFKGASSFIVFGAFIDFFRMNANILAAAAHSEMRTKLLIRPYAYGGMALCAGTYAAAGLPMKDVLIPSAMAAGGLVTLLLMWKQVSRVINVDLNLRLGFKTAIAALPLLGFLTLQKQTAPAVSFGILSAAGLYFIWLQYLVAFRWTVKSDLSIAAQKAAGPQMTGNEGASNYE